MVTSTDGCCYVSQTTNPGRTEGDRLARVLHSSFCSSFACNFWDFDAQRTQGLAPQICKSRATNTRRSYRLNAFCQSMHSEPFSCLSVISFLPASHRISWPACFPDGAIYIMAKVSGPTRCSDGIAVIGLAYRFPGGADSDTKLWDLLAGRKCSYIT